MKYNQYQKTLPLAKQIVANIIYSGQEVKSHQEYVDRINKAGEVNRMIIGYLDKRQ